MNIQTLSTAALHELRAKTKRQSDIEKIDEELQFRNDIAYSPMTDKEILSAMGEDTDQIAEIRNGDIFHIAPTRWSHGASLNQISTDAATLHQRFPANDVQNNALDAGESF